MSAYGIDVVPLLWGMILGVSAALAGLIVWVAKRLQYGVDDVPNQINLQVKTLHSQILIDMKNITSEMREMNHTHSRLEYNVREQIGDLDHRIVRIETHCEFQHNRRKTD